MYNFRLLGALYFLLFFSGGLFAKNLVVDQNSKTRGFCNVEFARLDGLIVTAKPVLPSALNSRINVERYSACPYDVQMSYRGKSIPVDFGNNVSINSLRESKDEMDIGTGNFLFDGENWHSVLDLEQKSPKKVHPVELDDSILLMAEGEDSSGQGTRCFVMAVLRPKGFVAAGSCFADPNDADIWNKLAARKDLIIYKK